MKLDYLLSIFKLWERNTDSNGSRNTREHRLRTTGLNLYIHLKGEFPCPYTNHTCNPNIFVVIIIISMLHYSCNTQSEQALWMLWYCLCCQTALISAIDTIRVILIYIVYIFQCIVLYDRCSYQIYYSQATANPRHGSELKMVNWWSAMDGLVRFPLLPPPKRVYTNFENRRFMIPVLHVRKYTIKTTT